MRTCLLLCAIALWACDRQLQGNGVIREGDWKLIEHLETGKAELYNLSRDVSERNDDRANATQSLDIFFKVGKPLLNRKK